MPWVRIGDTAHSARSVLRAQEKGGLAVFGFVVLAASWSSSELLDGFVSESAAARIAGPDYTQLVKDAQSAGLMLRGRAKGPGGERGWTLNNDNPDVLHIRLREEVERDRDKSRATRQVGPQRDVRLRDGDQCRYCGKTVNWADRRSARGGTYDHPDPADRDVFVICCFGCNRLKGERTAAQWHAAGGHRLLSPPDQPLIGDITARQYGVSPSTPPASAHPAPADDAATPRPALQADPAPRPGSQPDTAQPETPAALPGATGPDLDLPDRGVAVLPLSGRDGPQVGTGALVAQASRDGPRPRGRRGRRARPPPA